jgi:hypothetical protein
VVCLAIHLDKLGFEVGANLREDDLEAVDRVLVEYLFSVLGHEDQLDVNFKNIVSAVSKAEYQVASKP